MTDDPRNRLRRQVTEDVSASLMRLLRHDRPGAVILLLQVINAVWFATLWENSFRPVVAAVAWIAFFLASIAASILLEIRRR